MKSLEEGLAEALRWLHDGDQQIDLTPTDDRKVIEEAGEYCGFAAKYVDIADFHKMYGRGQVELEVDEAERKVRFVTPERWLPASSMIGMAEQSFRLGKLPILANPESKAELGREAVGDVTNELPALVEPKNDADERHRKDMERMMRQSEESNALEKGTNGKQKPPKRKRQRR